MERIESFVALGDSFTEGMHDDLGPDGRHLGWADRVAAALAALNEGTLRYANLAVRGRLLDQVVAEQVPYALTSGADLISFHAGPNDVLRPGVQLGPLLRRYEAAVRELRSTGAEVLLFTVVERAGGTGRLADALARRFRDFNHGIRRAAERCDGRLVDAGGEVALHDRRMWDEDRLHLAPDGHRRAAAAVLETLGVGDDERRGGPVGWWREPLPPDPLPRAVKLRADARWAGRYLAPWVWRRVRGVSSGDRVVCKRPELSSLEL